MNRTPPLAGATALLIAFALAAAPAAAAQKPITGKLPKAGYTAIALDDTGDATSVKVGGSKRFRLRPPADRVTLHLRNAKGVYAGPVVVGSEKGGRRAVLGLKPGAKLGALAVRKGHAAPKQRLARRWLDTKRTARAKKGVPVGAGVFGRVRSQGDGRAGPGRDEDGDGIPGAFDVDDDGDLILDNFEARSGPQAFVAQDEPPPPEGGPEGFWLFSNLKVQMSESLNANATDVTQAQVDELVSSAAGLAIQVPPGDDVELDCGGLVYCSAGGTGQTSEPPPGFGQPQPFPGCCDPDGDGRGSIFAGTTGDFQLRTGAPADEIGAGDTFIEWIHEDGRTVLIPGVLNYIFNTTPALIEWTDGTNSGQVGYPVEPGDPGQPDFPLEVQAGSDGDVVVAMTFWRPQRQAIEGSGEGTGFVDIGRLQYTADVPNGPGGPGTPPGAGPGNCPTSTYSTTDSNLQPHPTDPIGGLVDQSGDAPADPQNTLSFSINLTDCLASAGLTWTSGQNLQVDIQARSQFGDNAAQLVNFRLK